MNFYIQQILNSVLLLFIDGGSVVALIGYLLGAGGLVGGILALLKFRPEAGQILVTTAQGVVVIQTSVIESLQKEVARVSDELKQCKTSEKELKGRVFELEKQAGMHETRN